MNKHLKNLLNFNLNRIYFMLFLLMSINFILIMCVMILTKSYISTAKLFTWGLILCNICTAYYYGRIK